jgi:hypothetical protein
MASKDTVPPKLPILADTGIRVGDSTPVPGTSFRTSRQTPDKHVQVADAKKSIDGPKGGGRSRLPSPS